MTTTVSAQEIEHEKLKAAVGLGRISLNQARKKMGKEPIPKDEPLSLSELIMTLFFRVAELEKKASA